MHIRKISGQLWITTQELRQQLSVVNFWVKPDDQEIPDHLAAWIVRFLSKKLNVKIKPIKEIEKKTEEKEEKEAPPAREIEDSKPKKKSIRERRLEEERKKKEEDDERIRREDEIKKKKNLEKEFKRFDSVVKDVWVSPKGTQPVPIRKQVKPASDKLISVTRKIEINVGSKEDFDKRKTKKKEITEQEQRTLKKIKFKELSAQEIEKMSEEKRVEYFADIEENKRLEDERFKAQQQKKRKVVKALENYEQIKKKDWVVMLPEVISLKEYAEKIWIPIPKVIVMLMKNGIMATINQNIDFDTACLIADELKIKVEKEIKSASAEDLLEWDLSKLIQDDASLLSPRPPVVVVMWHVDHWKTSILDYYRNANVVSWEAWWITQHIWAYQIDKEWRKITFLDTPGHEAFTAMRARWAKITDIAVLVVAADDWVKEQTKEAYNHAVDAWVSIIVAINKIDKPWADVMRVKWQLADIWLLVEGYGWDVPAIEVSAKSWKWMDELLEVIFLVTDVKNPQANPNRNAIATVVESHLDKALWPVATLIVNTWTLKIKDVFIVWQTMWKVKSMIDSSWVTHQNLLPSWTAQVAGFEGVPSVWDILQVVFSEKEARSKKENIKLLNDQNKRIWVWLEEIQRRIATGKMNLLKIILKADTNWSLEAIADQIIKVRNDEVWVKIIHSWVWSITDSDVMMWLASSAIIIGFHVNVPARVLSLAEKEWVEIKSFEIIYEIVNTIKAILTWMLEHEEVEVEIWELKIMQIFYTKKKMMIVWWMVTKWIVRKWAKVIVERDGKEIWRSTISNLKFFKDNAVEVRAWNECGMQFTSKIDLLSWDNLKIYAMDKKVKSL